MGSTPAAANDFIQQIAKDLSTGNGTAHGQSFDDPAVLSPDEEGSALYLYPADDSNTPVFNFALARVRYVGLIGANDVRVFFRLFQAQTTSGVYDYPPGCVVPARGQQSRRAADPARRHPRIEYVTLPFFALPRINTAALGMGMQTDSRSAGEPRCLGTCSTSRRTRTAARSTRSSAAGSTSTSRR